MGREEASRAQTPHQSVAAACILDLLEENPRVAPNAMMAVLCAMGVARSATAQGSHLIPNPT